jgi:RNA polymerase sigma-70 factor, ECF subfamily
MVKGDPQKSKKPDEELVQKLVAACQNGDSDAFGQLYDLYVDMVYRYVYYRVSREEVEDITENIFVRVWENIDKYTPGKHPFSSWLFRIAHNLVVDHYRFHRKHISLRERLPQHVTQSKDDPVDWTAQRLNKTQVRDSLRELKEPYQQVLVLKFLSGFDNKEIAEVMGRTEGNVRILQYRALKALRKILEQKGIKRNN